MDLFVVGVIPQVSFISETLGPMALPIRWMPETKPEVRSVFSSVTYSKGETFSIRYEKRGIFFEILIQFWHSMIISMFAFEC